MMRAASVAARQLGGLGERADHERLRHADAQFAGDELEEDEPLEPVECRPPGRDALLLGGRIQPLERQDAILDPAERERSSEGRGRQLIQDEGRGFRAVADDRVAFFEDPFRQARRGQRPAID